MKLYLSKFSLNITLLLIISTPSICQEWNWEWSGSVTRKGESTWMEVQCCDLVNNFYCTAIYDSVLYMPDTTFVHPEQYTGSNCNEAILKYDYRGEFVKALDLYTIPQGAVYDAKVGTGKGLDIYITILFSWKVFIQDTVINHLVSPYALQVDGVVVKMTPDFDIVWAKLIGSLYNDNIYDSYVTPDEDIYVLAEHYCDEGTPIIFFEQDTLVSDEDVSTISKLDKDGILQWHKDFYGEISAYFISQGDDGLLYYWGKAYTNIVVDNDTIIHPSPQFVPEYFYAAINEDGIIEQCEFVDYGFYPYRMAVNSAGERYISGSFEDTLVIAGDTIIVPESSYYYGFIGKFDAQAQPIWYQVIPMAANQQLGITNLVLDDDHLILSISTNDDLHIADTVIPIFPGYETFVGEFSPEGDLLHIIYSGSTLEMTASNILLDNCKNPLISGQFRGYSYLGPDTLHSYMNSETDGFVARIKRIVPSSISLGPDTLACDEYTLSLPGYYYYLWNGTISQQDWYTVTESDTVLFGCANEDGCWIYDTVMVWIHPDFVIDLGPDTAISVYESILFTVPEGYESYLWSNTVTANSITIFGESYEPGMVIQVWVAVTDGPCVISDTVYVTIKNEFAVGDFSDISISLYPNPFNDCIYINSGSEINQIDILSLQGLCLISKEILNPDREIIKIHLEDLKQGVYFLKIVSGESESIKKIVKL
jgi:hypothetical protein